VSDTLYRDILLDHYKSKKHRFEIVDPTSREEGKNPLCGDTITLYTKMKGDKIDQVSYDGHGCSISMASSSMLCEALEGRSVDEALERIQQFKEMLLTDQEVELPDDIADLEAMSGVKQYPVRIKCALLVWNTAEQMLNEAREKEARDTSDPAENKASESEV
jgi:nitrogen fixation protein NifU and related proteins